MKTFIRQGQYTEGDMIAGDIECPQRPSPYHVFTNNAWTYDATTVNANVLDIARTLRAPVMNILDGLQISALVNADAPTAQAVETLKVGLRNITSVDLTAATDRKTAILAMVTAYKNLAKTAPVAIKPTFSDLLTQVQRL